jgi:hypothetical protein
MALGSEMGIGCDWEFTVPMFGASIITNCLAEPHNSLLFVDLSRFAIFKSELLFIQFADLQILVF